MEARAYGSIRDRLNKEGGKLFDKFVGNYKGYLDRLSLEFEFKRLEVKYPANPIRFINYNDFASLGHLPRYPDNADITCSLENIDRSSSLLVFISHCWLRGHPGTEGWDGKAHPDNANNDKYKLCVEGIQRFRNSFAPIVMHVFVWIDFGCMNQDDKDTMKEDLEQYDRIIECCDCLFTPIVDTEHLSWNLPDHMSDSFSDYKASTWSSGPDAYLNRAWCRVEMMYCSALPLCGFSVAKRLLFKPNIAFPCFSKMRLHLLYGTKEHFNSRVPILLPPFLTYFHDYHPLDGCLSFASDVHYIRSMLGDLWPYFENCRISLEDLTSINRFNDSNGHGRIYEIDLKGGDNAESERCCESDNKNTSLK